MKFQIFCILYLQHSINKSSRTPTFNHSASTKSVTKSYISSSPTLYNSRPSSNQKKLRWIQDLTNISYSPIKPTLPTENGTILKVLNTRNGRLAANLLTAFTVRFVWYKLQMMVDWNDCWYGVKIALNRLRCHWTYIIHWGQTYLI